MAQGLFNVLVTLYAVLSAIAIGVVYKRLDIMHKTNQKQIEFNEEVIKGFRLTKEELTKEELTRFRLTREELTK
jgi:hypothetical protein